MAELRGRGRLYLIAPVILLLIPLIYLAATYLMPSRPDISIEGQRAVLSKMFENSASIFMRITNLGGEDYLSSARTDMPGTIIELHDMVDGKMTKVEGIRVPAKDTIELRPAKFHIMVFKIPEGFKGGSEFTLYLDFKLSGERPIKVRLTDSFERQEGR